MKSWCDYCEPKTFIIYGFCKNCGRRCEPPLCFPGVKAEDYYNQCKLWNQERGDLILDVMRRMPYERMGPDKAEMP